VSFGDEKVQKVWEKGHVESHNDPNVRPLHWKNYLDKTDGELKCSVTADGARNSGV
jgi:hypothetical protein